MPQTVSKDLTLNVAPVEALAIVDAALPDAVEFQPYSHQLTASGGTAPYTWVRIAGSLPAGLSMDVNGLISGVPNASGSFSFTVQATDSGA
jgi:hypothetical protein